MTIVMRAFFPSEDFDYNTVKDIKDPNWKMLVPLMIFAVVIVIFGVYSSPIIVFLADVANGVY